REAYIIIHQSAPMPGFLPLLSGLPIPFIPITPAFLFRTHTRGASVPLEASVHATYANLAPICSRKVCTLDWERMLQSVPDDVNPCCPGNNGSNAEEDNGCQDPGK